MHADDIVILSDDPTDLQRALDAAAQWATRWRFHFAAGPEKSAVMCFGPGCPRRRLPEFRVGTLLLPVVRSYVYLGVVCQSNLGWRQHVDHLMSRGERKMAACLSWTASALLPVSFTHRIFWSYVCPSALYGLAFVPGGGTARTPTDPTAKVAPSVVVQGPFCCRSGTTGVLGLVGRTLATCRRYVGPSNLHACKERRQANHASCCVSKVFLDSFRSG